MIRKKRHCRRLETGKLYKPAGYRMSELTKQTLGLDEFEAIRLCDYEGRSQIEAAEEMAVSRATIQRLLEQSRKKIVQAFLQNQAIELTNDTTNIKLKGEHNMHKQSNQSLKIAFPTSDKNTIDGHFGHTKEFAVYTVNNNQINNVSYVTPPPHETGVLPNFLSDANIDLVITGGMGKKAIDLLKEYNIDVILGATGPIDLALNDYLDGSLSSEGDVCAHNSAHHHHHHDH